MGFSLFLRAYDVIKPNMHRLQRAIWKNLTIPKLWQTTSNQWKLPTAHSTWQPYFTTPIQLEYNNTLNPRHTQLHEDYKATFPSPPHTHTRSPWHTNHVSTPTTRRYPPGDRNSHVAGTNRNRRSNADF